MLPENKKSFMEQFCQCCKIKNTKISQTWIVVVVTVTIAIGLLAGIIVLAVINSNLRTKIETTTTTTNNNETFESPCQTEECQIYYSQLLENVDTEINPCEDFWGYTCKKKINDYFDSTKVQENLREEVRTKFYLRLKNILEDTDTAGDSQQMKDAKDMYHGCVNAGNISIHNMTKLGMPLLTPTWTPVLLEQFYRSKFGNLGISGGILFTVKVVNDFIENPENKTILLSPPQMQMLKSAQVFDKATLQEIVKYFEATTDVNNVIKDSDALNTLLEKLIKILQPGDENEEVKNVIPKRENFTVITIKDFQSNSTWLNWLPVFNNLFDGIKIWNENDKIIVEGMKYFEALSNITEIRNIVNLELLPLVGTIITQNLQGTPNQKLINKFRILWNLKLNDCWSPERWRECTCYTTKTFHYTLVRAYADRYVNTKNKAKLEEIIKFIISTTAQKIDNIKWIKPQRIKELHEMLTEMKRNYIYPEWIDDNVKLKAYYDKLVSLVTPPVQTNIHVQNVLSAGVYLMKKSLATLNLEEENNDFIKLSESILGYEPFCSILDNSLNVPENILYAPVFGDLLPVMNYGAIGSYLSMALAHGYMLQGSRFDSKGIMEDFSLDSVENKILLKTLQCFQKQYHDYKLIPDELPGLQDPYKIDSLKTLLQNAADNAGILISYSAYKEWQNSTTADIFLKSTKNYTDDQLFFISYAQSMCVKYWNGPQASFKLMQDTVSPAKYRVHGSLSILKEFATAFSCQDHNDMISEAKCSIL